MYSKKQTDETLFLNRSVNIVNLNDLFERQLEIYQKLSVEL